jgi:hypothetical protein
MTQWFDVKDALPSMLYTNDHPEPALYWSMPCVVQTLGNHYYFATASIVKTPSHIGEPKVQWHTISNITTPKRQDITHAVKYWFYLLPTP